MILLVDAGNTRIKWRIVEGRVLRASGVVPTASVADLAQAWRPYRCVGTLLSCVTDATTRAELADVLASRDGVVQWLQPEREQYGLLNHYASPAQLGADRYAALIAAARLKLGSCVVVCVGTATTVDGLDGHGEFLGGIILPGPDLMRAALLAGTGQIESRIQADRTPPAPSRFPRDTETAVATGIVLAQVGAIKAVCERVAEASAAPPVVILTGGARHQVRDELQLELIEIEDLVLEGLAWIARETLSTAH